MLQHLMLKIIYTYFQYLKKKACVAIQVFICTIYLCYINFLRNLGLVFLIFVLSVPSKAVNFANYPLSAGIVSPTPNILLLYDNSMSMDWTMNPYVTETTGGANPDSRSNIVRRALNSIFNQYLNQFNWGVEIFDTYGSWGCVDNNGRCGLYRSYEGNTSTMLFTNDCVNGISNSNGGLRCIPNPEPNGYNYITYNSIGGWMIGSYYKQWAWAVYPPEDSSGTKQSLFDHRNRNTQTWNVATNNSTAFSAQDDFSDPFFGPGTNPILWFGCIDAGNGNCVNAKAPRNLYSKMGWFFMHQFTGKGRISQIVQSTDTPGHKNRILELFAPELPDLNSGEIKNGAYQTPLLGSVRTAYDYFAGRLQGYSSPIQSCQKNFLLVATDGQPTADINANIYPSSDLTDANTGRAYVDLYQEINNLRSLSFNGVTYDIQTYVLGIGDITADTVGVAGLNKMAQVGGSQRAFFANDPDTTFSSFKAILDDIQYKIPIRQGNGKISIKRAPATQEVSVYKAFYAAAGNVWQGNVSYATPTATFNAGRIQYETGRSNDFTTGAAGKLTRDTVSGMPRQIITSIQNSSSSSLLAKPFQMDSLSNYAKGLLQNQAEDDNMIRARINYLRGNRDNEISNTNANGFRYRGVTVLGDIIDSAPVYVGPSLSGYSDSDFSDSMPSYEAFAKTNNARRGMVYVGANDGMLHGFDATTLEEVFSYIPNSVFSKLKTLSEASYTHEFFVNETPIVADIPVGSQWVTQLIGFPGAGGKGLFALDITSPGSVRDNVNLTQAERNAANIVLWELNGNLDGDIGYIINRGQSNQVQSYMSRQVGKLSNGKWAIITGNGYNSNTGKTALVIVYLDSKDNTPVYKKVFVPTATGGLSTPTLLDYNYDGVVDYAYAGDLAGNVWRFNLRGDPADWSAFKLFSAKAPDNSPQPIVVAPAITFHCEKNGVMVLVGTGKYFEKNDNAVSAKSTIYGLWDDLSMTIISRDDLVEQTFNFSGVFVSSRNAVNWSNKKGWFMDSWDRVIYPPYTKDGMVYFTTTWFDFPACGEGTMWPISFALQACTGASPNRGVFDINYDGVVNDLDRVTADSGEPLFASAVALQAQTRIIDASVWLTPKDFRCGANACDGVQTAYSEPMGVALDKTPSQRVSWREVMKID